MASDPHEPLTGKILEEVIDERVPKIIDERLDARLPIILGQFTEEVLLPAMKAMVSDSEERVRKDIAGSEYQVKVWVDEKLADLRGDIVLLTRKEDRKVLKIVDLLRAKQILNDTDVQDILRMEPFALS
jgi:hypothetical protein